jgi:hypothetical protein
VALAVAGAEELWLQLGGRSRRQKTQRRAVGGCRCGFGRITPAQCVELYPQDEVEAAVAEAGRWQVLGVQVKLCPGGVLVPGSAVSVCCHMQAPPLYRMRWATAGSTTDGRDTPRGCRWIIWMGGQQTFLKG